MKILALAILLSLLLEAASASDQASIRFDQARISVSIDQRTISYEDYDQISVGDLLSLPVADLLIQLVAGDSGSVSVVAAGSSFLATVDMEALAHTPTSAGDRYADLAERLGRQARLGEEIVESLGEVWIDGVRYARILIFPVTFLATGELAFHEQITLQCSSQIVSASRISRTSEVLSTTSSDGRREAGSTAADASVDYTIVTAARFGAALEGLATYRRQTGYRVEVMTVEDIESQFSGVDPAEQLRAYLQDFHARGGRFVLLAGDETVVPSRLVYQYNITGVPSGDLLQPSDLYFADLTGDWDVDHDNVWGERTQDHPDLNEELFVGRLPLADSAQFEKYTDNLITYETDPGHGDRAWLSRSLFYSSDQMRDYTGGGQHGMLAASLPGNFQIDTTLAVEQASGSDPAPDNLSASLIDNAASDGYGIVNIIAHGRSDGFVVRSAGYNEWPKSYLLIAEESGDQGCVDSMLFDGKPSFYVSLACDNGGYDLGPIAAERRSIVQTLLGTRDGAVGFVGNTRWGWVSSSYLLHRAFLDSLTTHPDRPAIEAMYQARKVYPYYRDLVYGLNYFGDPALRVYMDLPKTIDLLISGETNERVVTLSSNGSPVADLRVVVTNVAKEIVADGVTDGSGAFSLTGLPSSQLYTLTASKAEFLTFQEELAPPIVTGVDDDPATLPDRFALDQNYPNPFNPSTNISYQLPSQSDVKLSVLNILGQEVAVLVDRSQSAGEYTVVWNAGASASGVYFYRLEAGEFSSVRKMLLVR